MPAPTPEAAKATGAADAKNGGPGSANNGQPNAVKTAYDWGFNSSKKSS